MNLLDWLIIILYIAAVMGVAFYLTRSQTNTEDYYLAGKEMKWWQAGLSNMATQLGAISFVSAPVFVALKEGGGLKWLTYEFGVPLAMIIVMAVILPRFLGGKMISVYEYLENRFDRSTRLLISFLFQLGRGLATAVTVLAGGLIISTALGMSTVSAILLLGVITIIYDVVGGIRVVILTDVLQMIIIVVGIIICDFVALELVGFEHAWMSLDPSRFQILDFQHWGLTPGETYSFWPMTLGGLFLYASYYGTDQSQVQRQLTVGSLDGARKALLINAFGRFPIVLMYCLMGVFIGAVFASPDSLTHIASAMNTDGEALKQLLARDPDRMVPMFIFAYLPHGIIGFIFVAIMAALMSSLDSGLNSLSAVTMRDFYQPFIKPHGTDREYLIASKVITLFWGIFCVAVAILFASIGEATRQTTIVLINAVGSLLYGPILAAFLLGMLVRRVNHASVKAGVVAGIGCNLILWLFSDISWLWWNATGFVAAVVVALLLSQMGKSFQSPESQVTELPVARPASRRWPLVYGIVAGYFFLMILITYWIQHSR
ncbi:MAG: sodium transporter [Calditrichaeota bacterium]|nr:MAG: sodium transporter [Calditrichota bacterium]